MGTPQSVLHYLDEWPFMLMYILRLMMFAPHLSTIFYHRCYVTKVIKVISVEMSILMMNLQLKMSFLF